MTARGRNHLTILAINFHFFTGIRKVDFLSSFPFSLTPEGCSKTVVYDF